MECLSLEKNVAKIIYVIRPFNDGAEMVIGRGNESVIRVNDISVSRRHAMLRLNRDEGFFLSDNNSKFGTVVLVRH